MPNPSRKPRLRGVLHQYSAAAALGAGLVLVAVTPAGRATCGVVVFALSLVLQFGISATLHRGDWRGPAEVWVRRLDHSAIFVLIAGTYTPFALVGLPPEQGLTLLSIVWAGAAIGVLYCLANAGGAKRLRTVLALALGWSIVPFVPDIRAAYGDAIFGFLLGGGLLYTFGAVVYALERPVLWPAIFGFHEAFHVLTVAAAALHFAGVVAIVA